MSQAQLKTAFYNGMLNVSAFATAIGSRIYEGQGPQNLTLPHCVYNVVSDAPREAFDDSHPDVLIQVDIYYPVSTGVVIATATGDALFTGLHRQALTMTDHAGVYAYCVERGQLTFEEDAIRILSQWQIAGTRSTE